MTAFLFLKCTIIAAQIVIATLTPTMTNGHTRQRGQGIVTNEVSIRFPEPSMYIVHCSLSAIRWKAKRHKTSMSRPMSNPGITAISSQRPQ